MKLLSHFFICALACGCGAAPTRQADEDQSIQGGARDPADAAVGLVWLAGGGFCSGSLIAPDVVLTAAHCAREPVTAFYTGEGRPTTDLHVNPVGGMKRWPVIDRVAWPGYSDSAGCPSRALDVGLLLLQKPVTGARPLALAGAPPRARTTCRTVGYGIHDDARGVETLEQKRRADVTVLSVDASAVLVEWKSGISDHGDSGGPLLCGGQLVGDTSCGVDGSFPDHTETWYARTDRARDWIDAQLGAWRE
jgi:hypothetical protein